MHGNRNARDVVIRRRVVLEEGLPFDEELLVLSITRINQLGIFELLLSQIEENTRLYRL